MVGAEEVVVNTGGFEMFGKTGRDEKIINAPADVAFASSSPI